MKTIICQVPSAIDGCSFYRSIVPLSMLRKTCIDLNFHFHDQLTWAHGFIGDIAFMQRPMMPQDVVSARDIKSAGIPLWIDWDDFLPALTPENPAYEGFNAVGGRTNVAQIVQMADVVTVSTEALVDVFKPLCKRVELIPNALHPLHEMNKKNPEGVVFWRGGNSHAKDLNDYAGALEEVIGNHPKTNFQFLGLNPWMLTPSDNLLTRGKVSVPIMFATMAHFQPQVMHVPLSKNNFNLFKSNISYLEGTWAGALMVVPDFPEFNVPGVITYKAGDEASFQEAMEKAISMDQWTRWKMVDEAQEYVTNNLLLETINLKRKAIIEELTA